jgi:hypothetical protein
MTQIYIGLMPTKVYLLLDGQTPIEAYTDKEVAHRDCYICNEAEKFSPTPMPFSVKEVLLRTDTYEDVAPVSPAEA